MMSLSDLSCGARQRIHEVDRAVISLPDNASFYSLPQFIAVAFDATSSGITPTILGGSRDLPYLSQSGVFSELCRGRAMLTVDHELVTNEKLVTPEQYLGMWREALKSPMTVLDFAIYSHCMPVAIFCGRLEGLRGKRSHWTRSPFATFEDFETTYRDQIAYLDDGCRFQLVLDLSQENAARDAFYMESFISSANRANATISVALRPSNGHEVALSNVTAAQRDLFVLAQVET
jgi:hypothetical protein